MRSISDYSALFSEKLTDMLAKRCTVMADVDINFHGEDDDLFRTFLAPQSQYRQTAEVGQAKVS